MKAVERATGRTGKWILLRFRQRPRGLGKSVGFRTQRNDVDRRKLTLNSPTWPMPVSTVLSVRSASDPSNIRMLGTGSGCSRIASNRWRRFTVGRASTCHRVAGWWESDEARAGPRPTCPCGSFGPGASDIERGRDKAPWRFQNSSPPPPHASAPNP
jgi:hypothetical protein